MLFHFIPSVLSLDIWIWPLYSSRTMTPFSKQTYQQLRASLMEDLGEGDLTSKLLIPASARAKAVLFTKESGVFCGQDVVTGIVGTRLKTTWKVRDGQKFSKGKTLVIFEGNLRSILAIERTALNFLGRLCGIATLTSQFVEKAKSSKVKILDTRKTTPLWRELEKYAVKIGGGHNHRFGLYDEIFVKENHKTYGNLQKLKRYPRRFVMEVCHHAELVEALALKPRVILFDNYQPNELKRAVKFARSRDKKVLLEASGGITLSNIAQFARTGIDQVSIGALTHSIQCLDLSLLVTTKSS